MKKLTTFLLLLMGLTSFNAWANTCGDCDATGYVYVDKKKLDAENKAFAQKITKQAQDLMAQDNQLAKTYRDNPNLMPFQDYLNTFKSIKGQDADLFLSNKIAKNKAAIKALIAFKQNFRKNMNANLKLAKERGFEKFDSLKKVVEDINTRFLQEEQQLQELLKKAR